MAQIIHNIWKGVKEKKYHVEFVPQPTEHSIPRIYMEIYFSPTENERFLNQMKTSKSESIQTETDQN